MNKDPDSKLEPKTCEACGEVFGCGARLDGCWCTDVKLPADAVSDLQRDFQDCLCPRCLEKKESRC